MPQRIVMHDADIARALRRISHEILESNRGPDRLLLLGVPTRGVPLAERIAADIAEIEPTFDAATSCGALDVTLYRDDLAASRTRTPAPTFIPSGIDGATVVLVDDVLYSGRTIRAALDAISDLGRPSVVRLAALVDRGHRELPIRADFVGKNLPSAAHERINVHVREIDGDDFVGIDDTAQKDR